MDLVQVSFLLFAAVAAGGLLMAALIVAKRAIPAFLGPGHGVLGLIAAGLLLAANLRNPATSGRAWLAFAVFAVLLVVGTVVFAIIFRKRAPLFLVAGHGSVGLVGLYLLYPLAFPG